MEITINQQDSLKRHLSVSCHIRAFNSSNHFILFKKPINLFWLSRQNNRKSVRKPDIV